MSYHKTARTLEGTFSHLSPLQAQIQKKDARNLVWIIENLAVTTVQHSQTGQVGILFIYTINQVP